MPWAPDWNAGPPIRRADGIKARNQRGSFAKSWWATRWITALERLVDSGRLSRGRSYARAGQVVKLEVHPGRVDAQVQGSRPHPYTVTITVPLLPDEAWERVADVLTERALYAAQLLAGEMPTDIEDVFASAGASLFPEGRHDLIAQCSCPDWGDPCKHTAAVCYLLGERFEEDPFLMFELRGRGQSAITATLRERRSPHGGASDEDEPEMLHEEPLDESLSEEQLLDMDAFWRLPDEARALGLRFDAPPVDAIPIKVRGAPALASDPARFIQQMELVYQLISREARRQVLEDQ
jgi:uncharacterized Zn finger protein